MLVLLSMPLIGIDLIRDEFTPVQLVIEQEELIGKHTSNKYEIPLNEVKEVQLLTELPSLSKSVGTNLDTLLKGSFYSHEVGKCEVLLNPANHKFIQCKAKGKWYIFSGTTDKQTQKIYEQLKKICN